MSPSNVTSRVRISFAFHIPLGLYGELIKAKQTFLLLYTALLAFLIAGGGVGSGLGWLALGMFFAVAGSTLLNMWWDRDIDALMERTRSRALPAGRVHPLTVLGHGLLFTVAGVAGLALLVNVLTAALVLLGAFIDVVVYSVWLKRRTHLSIVFGGLAGGLPAVAGWTAATGRLDLVGVLLGLFVVCWVPLHILTLAMLPRNYRGYRNARVPMWPVARGNRQARRVVTLAALLTAGVICAAGVILGLGPLALLPLLIVAGWLGWLALANLRRPDDRRTFAIFKVASMFMAFAFLWLLVGVRGGF